MTRGKFFDCVGMSRERALAAIQELESKLENLHILIGSGPVEDAVFEEVNELEDEISTLKEYIEDFLFMSVNSISSEIETLEDEVKQLHRDAFECEDAVDSHGYHDSNRLNDICSTLTWKERRLDTLVQLKKDWLAQVQTSQR